MPQNVGRITPERAEKRWLILFLRKRCELSFTTRIATARTVGDIYVGSTLVNEKMVKDGWAWNYARYSKSKHYAELEREAREARRGLWAGKMPIPPWAFRA